MITPEEIRARLLRRYLPFLRAWLDGENLFPMDLPVGRLPADFAELRQGIKLLRADAVGQGYRLEEKSRQFKTYGRQVIPIRIWIDTEADFLNLLGKQTEFNRFCEDVARIRHHFPQLQAWLVQSPQQVIDYQGKWPQLLDVCAFFVANPQSNRFVRELPITQDTKFIETHGSILRSLLDALIPEAINPDESAFARRFGLREDVPLVRIRFLDRQLEHRFGLRLDDLTLPVDDLNNLILSEDFGLVLENKTTFLSLPPFPDAFAIWGQGFSIDMLRRIAWLEQCPLIYWGDLDAQGFQILSRLRGIFPQVRSALMDRATYDKFSAYSVRGTPISLHTLPHLTPDEHDLYLWLAERTLRLEQERIPFAHAVSVLSSMM